VVAEIDRIFNGDDRRPITNEDLHRLEYCEAVIKEVGRLCPTISSVARINHEVETVNGHQYSTGTKFTVYLDGIHNQDAYYPDPEKFQPERFLDKETARAYERENKLVIFGGGARVCPGRKRKFLNRHEKAAMTILTSRDRGCRGDGYPKVSHGASLQKVRYHPHRCEYPVGEKVPDCICVQ
jgi:cytochrome P450